jgi:sugar phosphate isomerase/epimerase
MKTGLASFAFRWAFKSGMRVDEFLRRAADLGADVVQLCENTGVEQFNESQLAELAATARELRLALECGASGCADSTRLAAGIARTAQLGGTIYRCVIDSDGCTPDAAVATLRGLLPLLRERGVVFCAENHFHFSPRALREIVTRVDDPAVRVCLDPLNSIAQWTGPEETIRELAPLARTAHVKDARIVRGETGWTITGTALGEGDLDLAAYLAAVAPRVDSVLLESWMDPVDGEGGARTLAQEARWAQIGLSQIRRLLP